MIPSNNRKSLPILCSYRTAHFVSADASQKMRKRIFMFRIVGESDVYMHTLYFPLCLWILIKKGIGLSHIDFMNWILRSKRNQVKALNYHILPPLDEIAFDGRNEKHKNMKFLQLIKLMKEMEHDVVLFEVEKIFDWKSELAIKV